MGSFLIELYAAFYGAGNGRFNYIQAVRSDEL
jgi:hypothetical protein